MKAKRRPSKPQHGPAPATDRGAANHPAAASPWRTLSDPLAGYAQLLATRLAAEFPAQAAVVRLAPRPDEPVRDGYALGARYAGTVCGETLEQWARSRGQAWLTRARPASDAAVRVRELSPPMKSQTVSKGDAFIHQLGARHALLAYSAVGEATLLACLFLAPRTYATVDQQARRLQDAIPAITGRLTLILRPPVVRTQRPKQTPLSAAEQKVFDLLLQRCSERAIAEHLGKSRNTVHSHVKNIYLKLGVHSRKELRANAHRVTQLRPTAHPLSPPHTVS